MARRSIVDDKLFSTKELARLTSLSASFFEKGRVYGYGPVFHKLNGKIVYRLSDVEEWLDAQRQSPGGARHG